MNERDKIRTTTIDVNDILEVMSQHNFSNQRQIELLDIIGYILFKKQYPEKILGIIKRKKKLLQQPSETTEKDDAEVASVKVRSVVILEFLQKMQLGWAQNDLSKICKLIAFLTGNSYTSIYKELQKRIFFSTYHKKQIEEINKILGDLNSSISIDKDKEY